MIRRLTRALGLLALLIPLVVPTAGHAMQSNTHNINIWTVTSDFGEPVYDVCYQLFLNGAAWSNVGCDQNLDGAVYFEAVPASQYEVRASYPNGSDYFVEPFITDVSAGSTDFTAFA